VKALPGREKVSVIGVRDSYRLASDRGLFAEVRSGINSDRLTLLNAWPTRLAEQCPITRQSPERKATPPPPAYKILRPVVDSVAEVVGSRLRLFNEQQVIKSAA
jgi:hypothetical protein